MRGNSSKIPLVQRSLYPFLCLTISLLVYVAILIIPIPKEIGLAARYGLTTVLIVIALLFYPAYSRSGWIGLLASLSLTLILFALPLSGLWNSGDSYDEAVGGLLPWSDASVYYWDARMLVEGSNFSVYSSRRPLFPGMLAALLGLTQQNLQFTLAILVAINAISCFFVAREIQRSHGVAAGVLALTTLFLFYRNYSGTAYTENLGLVLGVVGLALLWRGARQRQINHCLLGILLLTLALNARAGAFFVLPAIILWGAWSFRGAARFSRRFLIGGSSVVLLGFLLNLILLKVIASPEAVPLSNFSYTLYGLIVGGRWTTVLSDHPELNVISEPELSRRIYDLAFEALRANPFGLVTGSLRAWKEFMFDSYTFSFIQNFKFNLGFQILSVIGLFSCFQQRRDPNASLIVVATLGILASVPFVPPWDTVAMRAYAATIPFVAILPALGFAFLAKKMKLQQLVKAPSPENSSQGLVGFSIILAVFVFVAPITTKVFSRAPQLANVSCQDGTQAVYLRISPGSSINLVADNSVRQTHLPDVRISDFRKGLANFAYPEFKKEMVSLSPSTTIMNTFNFKDLDKPNWLITNSTKLQKPRGIVAVCGKDKTNISEGYSIIYGESIQRLSANNN
jgi:hypothetical protein